MKFSANLCTIIRMMNAMTSLQKGKSKYPLFDIKMVLPPLQKVKVLSAVFFERIYFSRYSRHESEAQSSVDVSAIKGIMSGLKLPDSAIPSWGVHLSDKDFIAVIKDTIKDKKTRVEAAESSKSDENVDQSNN